MFKDRQHLSSITVSECTDLLPVCLYTASLQFRMISSALLKRLTSHYVSQRGYPSYDYPHIRLCKMHLMAHLGP